MDDFLATIAAVESGCDDTAISKTNDRGRYQISEGVWYTHSNEPHYNAHKETKSTQIAVAHIAWLIARIPNPTPRSLALAWHAGIKGYKKPTKTQTSYVTRVANYYDSLRLARTAAASRKEKYQMQAILESYISPAPHPCGQTEG